MYVFAVNIRNFRSFKDIWVFPHPDVNVIVGPNNCGKSTLVRGLSLIIDPNTNTRLPNLISRFDFYKVNIDEPIEITVWLEPLSHIENGTLIYDESDSIKKLFLDKITSWKVVTFNRNMSGADETHPSQVVPFTVDPMQPPSDNPNTKRLLAIRLQSAWNPALDSADTEVTIIDEKGNPIAALSNKHKELLGFKVISAKRNPTYELSLAKQSTLSRMVDNDEIIIGLRELIQELDKGKNHLLDKPSIRLLLGKLSSLIAPELMGTLVNNLGTEFSLTFLGGELWRLRGATTIATNIAVDQDNKFSLPLEYQGDGAQNLLLIAHLINLLKDPKDNDIVILEEPEQNLEPSLARWIFGELCSLTEKTNSRVGQIFITTHSTAMVGELKGAEALLIFSDNNLTLAYPPPPDNRDLTGCLIISGRNFPPDTRKKLDQHRDKYIPALFARHVLVVEGSSELGFLPVAFRYFSNGAPSLNPFHLGLEIVNGDCKTKMLKHAKILRTYGKKCHLLFDYDIDDSDDHKQALMSQMCGEIDYVTCWPEHSLLTFTPGCDNEVILAHYVSPDILFEAIKLAYDDAGHEFDNANWEKALTKIKDEAVIARLPRTFEGINLDEFALSSLGEDETQKAFLFALLHGPHDCKATKDMRMIAGYLAEKKAIPILFDDLRKKVIQSILSPEKVDHNAPYLAAK